jgi:hypothetical protein
VTEFQARNKKRIGDTIQMINLNKARVFKRTIGIICCLLLGCCLSCTYAKTTTQINNDFIGNQYAKIMVGALIGDIELQKIAENKLVSNLAYDSIKALRMSDVFFGGISDYTSNEIEGKLAESKVEAILIIFNAASGEKSTYVPATYHTVFNGNTATTRTYGGYNINKPYANFDAVLYDAKTSKKIWIASIKTRGNAFASYNDLVIKMAGEVVRKLKVDNVLKSS